MELIERNRSNKSCHKQQQIKALSKKHLNNFVLNKETEFYYSYLNWKIYSSMERFLRINRYFQQFNIYMDCCRPKHYICYIHKHINW